VRRLLSLGLCVSLVALGTVACGGSDLTDLETSPSQTITESFTGTLNPNGGTTHAFIATGKGAVVATLTAVGGDNTAVVGLALGNWTGSACNLSAANDNAIATIPLAATVTAAGQLCARVYDTKGLAEATAYTLQVIHP
jgi:hypothetical protein